MEYAVNVKLIKEWMLKKAPLAISKLALRANVSEGLIRNAMRGIAPKKPHYRAALAKAISVDVKELFPLVGARGKAS